MLKKFGHNIISIDGTHGTNEYEFTLTTLMVVDDYGMGVPVAFLVSNRENAEILNIFFNTVKKEFGECIDANVFMSDDYPAYINAWTTVRFFFIFM